jgi:hypothetical protein
MDSTKVSPNVSLSISIMRVLCIAFMMTVHVNPAFDLSAYALDEPMRHLGAVLTETLGRASVATLSFVSGWLLVGSLERRAPPRLALDRLRTLYLPMATWNALFIAATLLAAALFGTATTRSGALAAMSPLEMAGSAVLDLDGSSASPALGFLRDLAACSLIVIAGVSALRQIAAPAWARAALQAAILALCVAATLLNALEPLVLRPSILLFMTAGALLRWRGGAPRLPGRALPALLALVATVALAVDFQLIPALSELGAEVWNLLLRVTLTAFMICLAGVLARRSIGARLAPLADAVYLAYLSHTIIISTLWQVWRAAVPQPEGPAYPIFYLAAPAAAMAAAVAAAPLLGWLPPAVQIALAGKVRPRPHPFPRKTVPAIEEPPTAQELHPWPPPTT